MNGKRLQPKFVFLINEQHSDRFIKVKKQFTVKSKTIHCKIAVLKQLFTEVEVASGGYLPPLRGSVNIQR